MAACAGVGVRQRGGEKTATECGRYLHGRIEVGAFTDLIEPIAHIALPQGVPHIPRPQVPLVAPRNFPAMEKGVGKGRVRKSKKRKQQSPGVFMWEPTVMLPDGNK